MKVTQDHISQGLLALAVALMFYFLFVVGLEALFYPLLLLAGCAVFRVYINKPLDRDEELDRSEGKKVAVGFVLAFTGIIVGNLFVHDLYRNPQNPLPFTGAPFPELAALDATFFAAMMAIVEEQFFRGEIFEWLAYRSTPGIGIIGSAAFFTAYHFKVYGGDVDSLIYVLVGGVSLAWSVWYTQRLAPASLAHLVNNIV